MVRRIARKPATVAIARGRPAAAIGLALRRAFLAFSAQTERKTLAAAATINGPATLSVTAFGPSAARPPA